MNNSLNTVLKEMCHRVGADFNKIDFPSGGWFLEATWTQEEEEDFKKWLADYIYNNKEARKEITSYRTNTKKNARQFAEQFIFNYGWKEKIEDEIA
jgi:hypothetical protein